MTVQQILDAKGHDVHFVHPEDTVFHALRLMDDKNIGAVLVEDHEGQLVGIFTERHYARKVFLKGEILAEDTHSCGDGDRRRLRGTGTDC